MKRIVNVLGIPIREVPRSMLWNDALVEISVNTTTRLLHRDAGFLKAPHPFANRSQQYARILDRTFVEDVRPFLERGYYRQSLELVQAAANMIMTLDDYGVREVADEYSNFLIRDRNRLEADGASVDAIAAMFHVNESGCASNEVDYCESAGVSRDRFDEARICQACRRLKHRFLDDAEAAVEALWAEREGLSSTNRARVYGLLGRLLLHRSKGRDAKRVLEARRALAFAVNGLPDDDIQQPHYQMLLAAADWLISRSEEDAIAVRIAARKVDFGVGESCIEPGKVVNELLAGE